MAKVVAIASGKGGVGKTTLTLNLGVSLGQLGKRVLVVDGDLAMGNAATLLGLYHPPVTLHEVLSGEKRVGEALYRANGISFLPSGPTLEGFLKAAPRKLEALVKELSPKYEFILLDTPPGVSRYSLSPLAAAQEILILLTPDPLALESALKVQTVAEALEVKVGGAVVNRVPRPSFLGLRRPRVLELKEIERKLGVGILASIPEDPAVTECAVMRKLLVLRKPKSPAARAVRALAARLAAG
jgi:septum site-determining protein MinD